MGDCEVSLRCPLWSWVFRILEKALGSLFVLAGIAFFMNSVAKPVAEPVAALAPAAEAVAGAVPSLPLSYLSILRFILAGLGVPLDPLIEGSRKCVTELGPETVGAVKTLLVMWAFSLPSSPSLCGYPFPGTFTIM